MYREDDGDRREHRDNDRRPDYRHNGQDDRRDHDGKVFRKDAADADKDAVRVEVKAYVKDKDFEGKREMYREDDRRPDYRRNGQDDRREDRRDDKRDYRDDGEVFRKEAADADNDAVRVEVKAYVKDRDFEGKREMYRD